jgi:hypothetical protein
MNISKLKNGRHPIHPKIPVASELSSPLTLHYNANLFKPGPNPLKKDDITLRVIEPA